MHPLHHHAPAQWSVPFSLTVLFFALAALYFHGWLRIRSSAGKLSVSYLGCFLSGLILLWIALASPLASYVHQFLAAHMLQHLLLMTIAPALILLAAPLKVFQQALPPRFVQKVAALLRVPPFPQFGRFLTNPIVCWLASAAVLIGWHIPAIFARSFESPSLHQFEQLTFVFAGLLFWWPVIRPWPSVPNWPRWLILLYLLFATFPCDILSAYLTFCERVVYTPYLTVSQAGEPSVLKDQEFAGALMWTSITLIYLAPAVILTVRFLEGPAAKNNDNSATLDPTKF